MVELNKHLKKLQEKCNLNDSLMEIISSFLDKLLEFGYITSFDKMTISKKLLQNIDIVLVGNKKNLDFKSGYYDVLRKELYLQDLSDIASIYLRLAYVITSRQVYEYTYLTGFSKAFLSKESYKPVHLYYGFNRAVISNLICRLCYTLPSTLEVVPSYRTYQQDFLGRKITSENNMYYMEGAILRQLCFITNIEEEKLYLALFKKNPLKELSKLLKGVPFESLLIMMDDISKSYSNYNKLCYYNKRLSEQYLELKKHSLNKGDKWQELVKEKRELERKIKHVLANFSKKQENDLEQLLDTSLTEEINKLEQEILLQISHYQATLTTILIEKKNSFSPLAYAVHLKKLSQLLVIENENVQQELIHVITNELTQTKEADASNTIQKIKYSITNYLLPYEKYSSLFYEFEIALVKDAIAQDYIELVLLFNGAMQELVIVDSLDTDIDQLNQNVVFLKGKNFKHLLNTYEKESSKIEMLFTQLKNSNTIFQHLLLENVFLYEWQEKQFLLVIANGCPYVIKLEENNLFLLENSNVYALDGKIKNLPTLMLEKGNTFKWLLVSLQHLLSLK